MRISELEKITGVPLSAVKYYQREGLLPDGEKTAPNQTSYNDTHVQRIRLIRALIGVGGLSIAAVKKIIETLDAAPNEVPSNAQLHDFFTVTEQEIADKQRAEPEPSQKSRELVLKAARAQGWIFSPDNPGITVAARALDGLLSTGLEIPEDYLLAYAHSAQIAAEADLQELSTLPSPEQQAELMVIGGILGDPFFAGFRRLAHQNFANHHFPKQTKAE